MALPCGSVGKEYTCNVGNLGSIPGLGRSLEKGKATHSSVLAWRIPWVAKSWTRLDDYHFIFTSKKPPVLNTNFTLVKFDSLPLKQRSSRRDLLVLPAPSVCHVAPIRLNLKFMYFLFLIFLEHHKASLVAQLVKNPPTMQEIWV